MIMKNYQDLFNNIVQYLTTEQYDMLKNIDSKEALKLTNEHMILLVINITNNHIINDNNYYKYENYNSFVFYL